MGYIAIKDSQQLCHLFVLKDFHQYSIGTCLWKDAFTGFKLMNEPFVEVRASFYALEFYKRLGFVEIEPPVIKEGVGFVKMRLNNQLLSELNQ